MMFFINHVQTYCNVNQKGKEMNEFIEQFDRYFVCDDCALDALKCELEAKVKELNGKYPKVRRLRSVAFVMIAVLASLVSRWKMMIINRYVPCLTRL